MSKVDVLFRKFKDRLINAEDLGEAASAMLDLLEEEAFLDKCRPKGSRILDAYLPVASETLFGEVLPITRKLVVYSKAYHFYHGGCFLGNALVTMGYSEKLGQGLLMVQEPGAPNTRLLRVTNTAILPADQPVFLANPAEPASD